MARALIVACGGRGCALGGRLVEAGWAVRGTSRSAAGAEAIERAGIEPAIADPDRIGTVLEQIEGVSAIVWLLGSAEGSPQAVAELHGPRLERLLEEIVDTPVRGLAYETAGSVDPALLASGASLVAEAGARWRIRHEPIAAEPGDCRRWLASASAAVQRLLA